MTPRQLRTIIETALRDQAPLTAAELEHGGQLEDFLATRVEVALDEIEHADSILSTPILQSDLPYLERVQKLTEVRKRVESAAIANATEFEAHP
jgi:hypothetical protein